MSDAGRQTDAEFRQTGERDVHVWNVWRLVTGSFLAPSGEEFERTFVRSPGAVGVVPLRLDDDNQPSVVFVRQYRSAFDALVLEVPAGMRDVDGEPAEETARRELIEEAGLDAGRIQRLTTFLPSAGLTDATLDLFVATELYTVAAQAHGPEEEHMEVIELPLVDALAMVERGELADAKTVIGLLMVDRLLAQGLIVGTEPRRP
jgi:ADP-ribose pyrophosphatase